MTAPPTPKVLYVGLDACDSGFMEGLAAAGRCPTLAGLLRDGAVVPTVAPYGTFVGSSWMTITTGRDVSRHGYWNWAEVDRDTYTVRPTTPRSADGAPFWQQVDDAGRRVAVLDVPHMDIPDTSDGMFVKEWGCHDRHDGTATHPASLLEELDRVVGRHPLGCVDHPTGADAFAPCDYTLRQGPRRTIDEQRRLADLLRAGLDAKHRATVHVMDQGPWDLFITVLGETHCAGHQFWHLHDPGHPHHDPAARRVVGDPIDEVYVRLDGVLGDLLARVGPDTTVYVQMNHGMGPHFDGDHLLDQLLLRIDRGLHGEFRPGWRSRLAARALRSAPPGIRRSLQRAAAGTVRFRMRQRPPAFATPSGPGPDRRWYPLPGNTSVGAVRFNLQGRESQGRVAPGTEYEHLRDELEAALLDVVDVDTGRPLVHRVVRAEDVCDRAPGDLLPDLFVEWNRDKLVERTWSPLTGVVAAPYTHWRTGDHHDRGLFIAQGPGITPGRRSTPLALTDVAPTVAAAVGVELRDIDGTVHPDLVPRTVPAPTASVPPRPPTLHLANPGAAHPTVGPPAPVDTAALDFAAQTERRFTTQIAELEGRLDALNQKVAAAEREHTVWATMAWLDREPVSQDTLVSVITPTYHRPAALAEAIRSVLAQRHQRWEMLIVDDGSHTAAKVAAEFGDDRIRVFDADHGGACAARNVALDAVQGDVVTYLDDDNLLDPGWLHAVVWAFRNHPDVTVLYGARIIDDFVRVHGESAGGWPWMQFEPFNRLRLENQNFADMGVIAHRADLPARFDPTLVECGDWDFLLALTDNAVPLELPAVAAYYRTDGDDRLTGQQPADNERVRRKWALRPRTS